jgi:hypothetical protein
MRLTNKANDKPVALVLAVQSAEMYLHRAKTAFGSQFLPHL